MFWPVFPLSQGMIRTHGTSGPTISSTASNSHLRTNAKRRRLRGSSSSMKSQVSLGHLRPESLTWRSTTRTVQMWLNPCGHTSSFSSLIGDSAKITKALSTRVLLGRIRCLVWRKVTRSLRCTHERTLILLTTRWNMSRTSSLKQTSGQAIGRMSAYISTIKILCLTIEKIQHGGQLP